MFVYVLKSLKDGKRYVGMTDNIARRLGEHNNGYVTSTAPRRPFELTYSEEVPNRQVAREREKYMKSAAGRKYLLKVFSRRNNR